MMGISKVFGLYALIPTTVLLTISFFVLVVVRKVETQGLKAFGQVIAVLLWIAAALVISSGIYFMSTGNYPMMRGMYKMMPGHMQGPMMDKDALRQQMNR